MKKPKWICKSYLKSMLIKSIPMQAEASNLRPCQKYNKCEIYCPIELMLISKIIPFMFIVV